MYKLALIIQGYYKKKEHTMDWKKVVGVVGVAGGAVLLYFGGVTEGAIAELVGGVFVLVGIIVNLLKKATPKE